jgi:hypothetical protein
MRIDSSILTPVPSADARPRPGAREDLAGAALTAEELSYFAELGRLGPLVYGRRARPADQVPPAELGRRVDVRA